MNCKTGKQNDLILPPVPALLLISALAIHIPWSALSAYISSMPCDLVGTEQGKLLFAIL